MNLRIGILGSRGIPNHYGGFEQLAQYLSAGLAQMGHEVFVYNSHNHPYQEKKWMGVHIVHSFDPEYLLGTAGQFIYDLNCTLDARKKKLDILLILGYTSSSVWGWLYARKTVCITNMDGMEWRREKYSAFAKRFLQYAEKLAIRYSDFFVADALPVQAYLQGKYGVNSKHIAYGAEVINDDNAMLLDRYHVRPYQYFLLIARMEKENNIETILDGMTMGAIGGKFLVIGNTSNAFGRYLVRKYQKDPRICFLQSMYDFSVTHILKKYCRLYFHGHSVGGTNPSLLEAMASSSLIAAHDNIFNRSVLGEDAFYFSSANDVKELIVQVVHEEREGQMMANNLEKIRTVYNWPAIVNQYERFITECYQLHE